MKEFLVYLFWPNPGNAGYASPKALALIVLCAALVLASFALSIWKKRLSNPQMRKLSRSWATASFWFGLLGLIMVVARVEQIQYVAMRFLWLAWLVAAVLYLYVQIRQFKSHYYEVLPTKTSDDPRTKYLPRQKRK